MAGYKIHIQKSIVFIYTQQTIRNWNGKAILFITNQKYEIFRNKFDNRLERPVYWNYTTLLREI